MDDPQGMFTQLENEWMDAVKRKDMPTLERFVSPEFALEVAVEGNAPQVVPRQLWLEASRTTYDVKSFSFDHVSVRLAGDVAIVHSIYTQAATFMGQDRSGEFSLVDVWIKQGDAWRVLARYSSRPEPPSAGTGRWPEPMRPAGRP